MPTALCFNVLNITQQFLDVFCLDLAIALPNKKYYNNNKNKNMEKPRYFANN